MFPGYGYYGYHKSTYCFCLRCFPPLNPLWYSFTKHKVLCRVQQSLCGKWSNSYYKISRFHIIYSNLIPKHKLILVHVLHVHAITKNLLSVLKFSNDNNVIFEFLFDKCCIKSQASKQVFVEGVLDSSGLYWCSQLSLELSNSHCPNNNLSTSTGIQSYVVSHFDFHKSNSCNTSIIWHLRLGHVNFNFVAHILKLCNISSYNNHNSFSLLVILVKHMDYMLF